MKKRTGILVLILIFTWFVLPRLVDLLPNDDKSVEPKDFEYFYNEQFAGKIEYINFDRGRLFLKIDNKNRTYVLYPLPRKDEPISKRIEIGDSLVKSKDSKFFTLIKENETSYDYEVFMSQPQN